MRLFALSWEGNQVRRWLTSGLWALIDQGAFAGSNFVINIALARWLLPDEYGAFSVVYAFFFLMIVLQTTIIIEPFVIFLNGKFKENQADYIIFSVILQWMFGLVALVIFLSLSIVFFIFDSDLMGKSLIGVAVFSPFIFSMMLFRRICYSKNKENVSAILSVIYFIIAIILLYSIYKIGYISPMTSFFSLGGSALIIVVIFHAIFNVKFFSKSSLKSPFNTEAIRKHKEYAKWATGNTVLYWLRDNIYLIGLPIIAGLEASGACRALLNLIAPASHLGTAMSSILLPALVSNRGGKRFDRLLLIFCTAATIAGMALWACFYWFHVPIVSLAYAGKYLDYSYLLQPLAVLVPTQLMMTMLWSAYLARESPKTIARGLVVAVMVGIGVGIPLMILYGISGVAIGLPLSNLVLLAILMLSYSREGRVGGSH